MALGQQEDLVVDRLDLMCPRVATGLALTVKEDLLCVSPSTEVRLHEVAVSNAWDLGEVYSMLLDFAGAYTFDTENEEYLVHITTGTHIAQICMFLLTESRHFPARLIQTFPQGHKDGQGGYSIIDLDLSQYDRLASRFSQQTTEHLSFLKSGIDTRNAAYNRLVESIERVAIHSRDPLLLCGPTGSGKSRLAKRIFELKKTRRQVAGDLVEFNCATLRGDGAMSTLFGHMKGAFTGAVEARTGLLRKAEQGLLFLDEVGELGLDEQAMLLRAVEEKCFYPVGSDREVRSDFQLLAGTNRNLREEVERGRFREDLLARIDVWTFTLPGLRARTEDLEPNLEYELEQCGRGMQKHLTFRRDARSRFLEFAASDEASWPGNFRDFAASVRRMATLSTGGRIGLEEVGEEIERLRARWGRVPTNEPAILVSLLGSEKVAELDRFDRVQLEDVVAVCRESRTLSDAGRRLFASSRQTRTSTNDADRIRKYLARFGLSWADLRPCETA